MLGGCGLLSWDLPCVRQCGRAALPVPGLPLLCAVLLGDTASVQPQPVSWRDSNASSGNAAANGE